MEVTQHKEQEGQSPEGKRPRIDPAIIEQLIKDYQRPEDLTGPGGIMEQLTKRLYERVLGAEMTHYLGYEKGQAPKADQQRENHRNGTSKKTIVSEDWQARDRGTPRPCWRVRATVYPQGAAALWGIRFQDYRHVCPRHDGTRDPGVPGRAI